ncbi:hypothetical protein A2480_02225 [Candidatus Uhrbacteria bacterium RIFOXYC2_FULL_47_19]|uniref:EamA domain-containing protein n=1 Tax=Candidatus Uhrbacteria bacterium RIFOXYC2_FULL_47_19 TaxID=1802424 RepID=A0A1F7WEY5_9BACT|nr:MAG: hypothetical protein A2480_02225 [Candidatus Uhrbacteria bacterium RIFOXYC2_FULL_47_19]HCC21848.1 hypothetical protein [Candidatus Uhrbacteria bacterium]
MIKTPDLIRGATILALITAAISGTNTFLAKFALNSFSSPVAYTTLKNALVAIALVGILLALKKRHELSQLSKRQILTLLAVGLIGGAIPFVLFFTGLTMTSATSAALIHKTLFIWVAIMAVPLLKERVSVLQWLGIIALFGANLLIGGFKGFEFNIGELMILGATLMWSVENVLAKKLLTDLSAITVSGARMIIGSAALIVYLLVTEGLPNLTAVSGAEWGWTLLTSALLLGYVITWYSALKRAPATYVATLLVLATLVTNVLSAIFITHKFTWPQAVAAALFVGGASLTVLLAFRSRQTLTLQPSIEQQQMK